MWDVHDGMMVSVERKAARLCLAVGTLTYKSRNLQLIISPPSTQPERGGLHDSTAQVCVGLQTIPSYTAFILRAPDSTNHTAAYFHFSVTRRDFYAGWRDSWSDPDMVMLSVENHWYICWELQCLKVLTKHPQFHWKLKLLPLVETL